MAKDKKAGPAGGTIKVKQVGSLIGCTDKQRASVRGLGLRRMHQVVERQPGARRTASSASGTQYIVPSRSRTIAVPRGTVAKVVSVFSTGILEAAARGVPAWAAYDRPPAWLEEFWERYAMSRYGAAPTPAPPPAAREPALAVAAAIEALL